RRRSLRERRHFPLAGGSWYSQLHGGLRPPTSPGGPQGRPEGVRRLKVAELPLAPWQGEMGLRSNLRGGAHGDGETPTQPGGDCPAPTSLRWRCGATTEGVLMATAKPPPNLAVTKSPLGLP